MNDVSVQQVDGSVFLVSPYNLNVPPRAKRLGGKWDAKRRAWRFDVRDLERVRALAADVFGFDELGPSVTVRINAEDYVDRDHSDRVVFAGRIVARRCGRDDDVRLAGNMVLVSGRFASSAGSRSCPEIGWTDDPAILEIRDIPASSLSKAHGKYEIVDDAGLDAGLLEERERLQARIREIDALLASHAVA